LGNFVESVGSVRAMRTEPTLSTKFSAALHCETVQFYRERPLLLVVVTENKTAFFHWFGQFF
jgi:hypothetical protein